MTQLKRRELITGAAALAAATAVGFNPLSVRSGSAQSATPPGSGVFRYKFGDAEIIQVLDGVRTFPMPETFVTNVPKDQFAAAFEKIYMPKGQLTNPFCPTVVQAAGKVIVIDTGNGLAAYEGTKGVVGQHRHNLAASGIDAKKVDIVLISHFHGDHINGLRNPDGSLAYPNAEIKVPAVEYAFWTDSANESKANGPNKGNFANVKKVIGDMKVTQFEAGKEVAPGVTAIASPGHTPGHTSFVVASGSKRVLVQGDIALFPSVFLRNPDWQVMFDNQGDLAVTTRRKMYDMAVAEKMPVIGYHFPFATAAYVEKDGNGYRLEIVQGLA